MLKADVLFKWDNRECCTFVSVIVVTIVRVSRGGVLRNRFGACIHRIVGPFFKSDFFRFFLMMAHQVLVAAGTLQRQTLDVHVGVQMFPWQFLAIRMLFEWRQLYR